ncbi:uncharacterized protein [Eurosta solidaginis]|uniref:uncharacterized protein n=1 Tax=Eurosta solidaginis TaxID=178769 RepID=UPI003530B295
MEPSTFQPGDICFECQQQGLNNRLRTFFIDVNEQIVKCESINCLYPYENDFSDSDEGKEMEGAHTAVEAEYQIDMNSMPIRGQKCHEMLPSLEKQIVQSNSSNSSFVTLQRIEDAKIQSHDYDDVENARFVEELLFGGCDSVSNGSDKLVSITNVVGKHDIPQVAHKTEQLEQQNSYSNETFDGIEGVRFIDAFSGFKTENVADVHKTESVDQINKALVASCNIPVLNYNLSNLPTNNEPCLKDVKKEEDTKIQIQSIKTFKPEIQSSRSFKTDSSYEAKFLDFIKASKIKQGLAVPSTMPTQPLSNSQNPTTVVSANSGNKTCISRYFATIRERQEKLENSISKFGRKKGKRSTKLPRPQKPSKSKILMNVMELVQTKKQK